MNLQCPSCFYSAEVETLKTEFVTRCQCGTALHVVRSGGVMAVGTASHDAILTHPHVKAHAWNPPVSNDVIRVYSQVAVDRITESLKHRTKSIGCIEWERGSHNIDPCHCFELTIVWNDGVKA